MLGEGMPWHIILIFMAIGFLIGLNNAKNQRKKDNSE